MKTNFTIEQFYQRRFSEVAILADTTGASP
jgi:hypothetical protein